MREKSGSEKLIIPMSGSHEKELMNSPTDIMPNKPAAQRTIDVNSSASMRYTGLKNKEDRKEENETQRTGQKKT